MNPAEREELAQLLPSPGDPLLPDDRLTRLEDHLMQEITGEATVRITGPRTSGARTSGARTSGAGTAGDRTSEGRTPGGRPALTRRRFALVAMPLGVAAAVLATVLATGVIGREHTADEEASGLLKRIVTAATEGEPTPVRDDQYLYIRIQGTSRDSVAALEDGKNAKTEYPYRRTDWISADGKRKGLARTDWLEGPPIARGMNGEVIEDPLANPTENIENMTLSADPNNSYHALRALPTDADKLYEKVWADTDGQGPTHEEAALEHIGTMLDGAQLLPDLNGALFRVAAEIPGVRIVEAAKDAVGREGVGLAFGEGDDRAVWVFDRESLKYLGSESEALLEVGVVDKVGETPKTPAD